MAHALRTAGKSFRAVFKNFEGSLVHLIRSVYIYTGFIVLPVQIYKKEYYISASRTPVFNLSFAKFFEQSNTVEWIPLAFGCFSTNAFDNCLHAAIDSKLRVQSMIGSHLHWSYVSAA